MTDKPMTELPWLERVTTFQVNPESASLSHIMRMAEDILKYEMSDRTRIIELESRIAEMEKPCEWVLRTPAQYRYKTGCGLEFHIQYNMRKFCECGHPVKVIENKGKE